MKTAHREVEIHYRWLRLPKVVESSPVTVELPEGARIIGTHPTLDGQAMWIYFVIERREA